MTSDLQAALTAIENRHTMDVEELSAYIQEHFSGSVVSLKHLEPLVREVNRHFRHLPRKQKVDGSYPNIAGYRTFKKWCLGVLRKNDRTARYMLAGGNKNRKSFKSKMATVSTLDIDGVMGYLKTNLGSLDTLNQEKLALSENL